MDLEGLLLSFQDKPYQVFQQKLIPNIEPSSIIGVRTPILRRLSKKLQDRKQFLSTLPHIYFEENLLHAFLLENEKDFHTTISQIEAFLPYVDNWATCDQLRPKVFKKHHTELLPYIQKWLSADHVYTIRYGIGMLLCHFLDDDFQPEHLSWVARVKYTDYYVKMMVSWYFATALAKQYNSTLPYISEYKLEPWTHRKTIQKAVESYRIPEEHKQFLKQFR